MGYEAESFDVAVVGGGIVGLGIAMAAGRRGMRTVLFEATARASGASIRNFGMIWPIGQPAGERFELAIRNRDLWCRVAAEARIPLVRCGSLHLAHHEDEWETLQQFVEEHRDPNQQLDLLSPAQTVQKTSAANPEGLRGSMYSRDECRLDPRQAIGALSDFLSSDPEITVHRATTIAAIDQDQLHSTCGRTWSANQIFVCSGADLDRLFPALHQQSGLRRCKLQMLRTTIPEGGWQLGPHLASGLTLRHYEAFARCPSQQAIRSRIAREAPELDRYGIHVMVSQALDGELVLGDSHEYDEQIEPFDKAQIDQWILREITKVFRLPTLEIQQRWNGIYAKHPTAPYWVSRAAENHRVTAVNGLGGAGMSLALALSEKIVEQL